MNIFYEGTSNINILVIYRALNQNVIYDFVVKLENIFDRISNRRQMIVGGDLNINAGNLDGSSMNFVDLMNSYSFMPHISILTCRTHEGKSSIIDHIWSDISSDPQSGIFFDALIILSFLLFFL